MDKNKIKVSIEMIKSNIRYEKQPGLHTFSLCRTCNKNGSRSCKCAECWKKDLAKYEKKLKDEVRDK